MSMHSCSSSPNPSGSSTDFKADLADLCDTWNMCFARLESLLILGSRHSQDLGFSPV